METGDSVLKKAFAISYSLFRIAEYLKQRHSPLGAEFEEGALSILRGASFKAYKNMRLWLEYLSYSIGLGIAVNLIDPSTGDVVRQEIEALKKVVFSFEDEDKEGKAVKISDEELAIIFNQESGQEAKERENKAAKLKTRVKRSSRDSAYKRIADPAIFAGYSEPANTAEFTPHKDDSSKSQYIKANYEPAKIAVYEDPAIFAAAEQKNDPAIFAGYNDETAKFAGYNDETAKFAGWGLSLNSQTRQMIILKQIQEKQTMQFKAIHELFPSISERTLRYDLQKLVEQGLIRRTSQGGHYEAIIQ